MKLNPRWQYWTNRAWPATAAKLAAAAGLMGLVGCSAAPQSGVVGNHSAALGEACKSVQDCELGAICQDLVCADPKVVALAADKAYGQVDPNAVSWQVNAAGTTLTNDQILANQAAAQNCPDSWLGAGVISTYWVDAKGKDQSTLVTARGAYQVCVYKGVVSLDDCNAAQGQIVGTQCQAFSDATDSIVMSMSTGSSACASSWLGHAFNDVYWRDAGGNNYSSPISTPGSYMVCDYAGVITSSACLTGGAMEDSGAHGTWCQQFTDSSNTILNSLPLVPTMGSTCPITWLGHAYTDTYWRNGTTDSPTPLTTPGSFQVCDYAGIVSDANCSAASAMLTSGPHGTWCQEFSDMSHTVLYSLARSSTGCASDWLGHPFHDTYWRDSMGVDYHYPISSPGSYQVCDYDNTITATACTSAGAMIDSGSAGTWCQQFTDSTNTVLNSLTLASATPTCAPTWMGFAFHDVYWRDAYGVDYLTPISSPGSYMVCDYDGTISASSCSSAGAMVISPWCQQFTDSTNTVLNSLGIASSACAPSWLGHAYSDTYWRDAYGVNYMYPISTPGSFQVCDYDGTVTTPVCLGAGAMATAGPHGHWCQEFTTSAHTVLNSLGRDDTATTTCNPTASPFGGGNGSAATPFLICSTQHLMHVGGTFSGTFGGMSTATANFLQTVDLDFAAAGAATFHPIGPTGYNETGGGLTNPTFVYTPMGSLPFTGTYDGGNHVIYNIMYNTSVSTGSPVTATLVGLFSAIGVGGTVTNVTIKNATFSNATPSSGSFGWGGAGTVAGVNDRGMISNVNVVHSSINNPMGFISGGVVGSNYGHVDQVSVTNLSLIGGVNQGGIEGVGWGDSDVNATVVYQSTISSTFTAFSGGGSTAGGIAGSITDQAYFCTSPCYSVVGNNSVVQTHINGGYFEGGLVGENNGSLIHNSLTTASVDPGTGMTAAYYAGQAVGNHGGAMDNTGALIGADGRIEHVVAAANQGSLPALSFTGTWFVTSHFLTGGMAGTYTTGGTANDCVAFFSGARVDHSTYAYSTSHVTYTLNSPSGIHMVDYATASSFSIPSNMPSIGGSSYWHPTVVNSYTGGSTSGVDFLGTSGALGYIPWGAYWASSYTSPTWHIPGIY